MTDRDPRTHAIIGAAMEVHRVLGNGFSEPVYQRALAVEFQLRGIPFDDEVGLPIFYKGTLLDASYRADFICYGEIIVELKALTTLCGTEEAQVINYLKATTFKVGLLLNFGKPSLEFRRFVCTSSNAENLSAKSAQSVDAFLNLDSSADTDEL
ncbi:MAG: GxxExxY protein [Planctomycetaceae bacterium]